MRHSASLAIRLQPLFDILPHLLYSLVACVISFYAIRLSLLPL